MQVLHDPAIQPRVTLSKEDYMKKDEKQTTVNHFHEKLLKLKDLMKTKVRQESMRCITCVDQILKSRSDMMESTLTCYHRPSMPSNKLNRCFMTDLRNYL